MSDEIRKLVFRASTLSDTERIELIRALVAPLMERLLEPEVREGITDIRDDLDTALEETLS